MSNLRQTWFKLLFFIGLNLFRFGVGCLPLVQNVPWKFVSVPDAAFPRAFPVLHRLGIQWS